MIRSRGSTTAARGAVLIPRLGWRSGPWACSSLRRAGFEVIAAEEQGCVPNRTRHAHAILRHPPVSTEPDAFVSWVEDVCARRGITAILPLDDEVVQLLTVRPSEARADAVLVGPTSAQYDLLCDKASLRDISAPAGFAQPQHALVTSGGREGGWPSLPSMVKPRTPGMMTASGLATDKPLLVSTVPERDEAVEQLVRRFGEALVEEHVRGDAWRVHFVRTPNVMVVRTLAALRSYPHHTGQSSVQRIASPPPGLVERARALIDATGYCGPGSVQVIHGSHGFFVHDVNLRLPVSVGATIMGGLDMPQLAVTAALGNPDLGDADVHAATYVSLLGEARQLLDGLCGRNVAAPPHRVALDIVLAAVSPHRILDPMNPRDPLPILLGAVEVARRLVSDRRPGSERARSKRGPRRQKA